MTGPAACEAHIHLRLPVEPESVPAAHRSVLGVASALDPSVLEDVRLLVSELVTNALRHGGLAPTDTIDLVLEVDDGDVRVEVRDPGPGFDPDTVPPARPTEGHGWGLVLLRAIAERWGIECEPGTRVWFEIDATRVPGADEDGNGWYARVSGSRGNRFVPRGRG